MGTSSSSFHNGLEESFAGMSVKLSRKLSVFAGCRSVV